MYTYVSYPHRPQTVEKYIYYTEHIALKLSSCCLLRHSSVHLFYLQISSSHWKPVKGCVPSCYDSRIRRLTGLCASSTSADPSVTCFVTSWFSVIIYSAHLSVDFEGYYWSLYYKKKKGSVARQHLCQLQQRLGHFLDVVQGFLSEKNSAWAACLVSPNVCDISLSGCDSSQPGSCSPVCIALRETLKLLFFPCGTLHRSSWTHSTFTSRVNLRHSTVALEVEAGLSNSQTNVLSLHCNKTVVCRCIKRQGLNLSL